MSKKTSRDVAILSGCIWNNNTRLVANAVNYNAQILKNVLDRVAELEKQHANMICPYCGARMEREHE